MKRAGKTRQILEGLAICAGFVFIPLLPRRCVVGTAKGLAYAAFRCSRKLPRIAMANLDTAFGNTVPDAEKQRIVLESFQTFALVILDIFWFGAFTRSRMRKYVSFDDATRSRLDSDYGLFITAHLGNWEVQGVFLTEYGIPLMSAAAQIDNMFADRILNRFRRLRGQVIENKHGVVRTALRGLRAGTKVAMLPDQNVLPQDGGLFVDFFGLPVPMSRAVAVLSKRTGLRILPIFCIPDGKGYYVVHSQDAFGGSADDASDVELTQRVANTIEVEVRRNPGCWLWMYKRWKYVPPNADRARYPFYARLEPDAKLNRTA